MKRETKLRVSTVVYGVAGHRMIIVVNSELGARVSGEFALDAWKTTR